MPLGDDDLPLLPMFPRPPQHARLVVGGAQYDVMLSLRGRFEQSCPPFTHTPTVQNGLVELRTQPLNYESA